jgi:acetylornithine deacetylase/succinyl-diaminopimelate desuccinylase-like protein
MLVGIATPAARNTTAVVLAKSLRGRNRFPCCGSATVSVGTIQGGAGVNTVPDRCTIEIEYRPLPGEELATARRRLLDHISDTIALGPRVEHDPPYMYGPPLSDEHNALLAERLATVVREVSGNCRQMGVPYCTNAPFFAAAGVPTVVFGPGFLEQAHAADESLPVDQLLRTTEVLYQFCREFPARFKRVEASSHARDP